MNITAINNIPQTQQEQTFKARPFLRTNVEKRPLSKYVKANVLPEIGSVVKIAKQYNLPVTIAQLGENPKNPQAVNRILVNVGPETRVFDPNTIPTNKFSLEITKFIREVSKKFQK